MKTNIRLKHLLSLLSLFILLSVGAISLKAQREDRDERGSRGENHTEYRVEPHGRYRMYEGRRYYTRAPWGMRRPTLFYHEHNRIYFYGGRYYQFYPGRGYFMIEVPMGYVFDEVPPGFGRVWINGGWCYRRGDIYLRPGVHGFVTFPGPVGIRIGARF